MVVLLTACGATAAIGRTVQQVEKTCPYDGTKFPFTEQASGTSFGQQLDLKPVGAIEIPWPIAVCPTNGFVFFKDDFDTAELERLKPLILSAEYQATKGETPYYRAYWIVNRSGGDHAQASQLLLAATWQAGGEGYARYATELLRRLPDDIAAAQEAPRRKFILLQGELLRRLGRFEEAAQHLRRWQAEFGQTSTEGLIAAYQLKLIAAHDTEPHLIADAIGTGESDPDVWLARRSPIPSGEALSRTNVFKYETRRIRPRMQWSADSGSLTGTEAPVTEKLEQRHDDRLIRFDLAKNSRTVVKTQIGWSELARSDDGKTILALESGAEWRYLQIDAQTLEIREATPAVPWSEQYEVSHDRKSLLVHGAQGLAALDVGSAVLRQLRSPAFAERPQNWRLVGADPTGPRVVILREKSVLVWDYDKGTFLHRLQATTWTGPLGINFVHASYAKDGRHLMVAVDQGQGREITCEFSEWDSQTGAQVARQVLKGNGASQLAVDGDGRPVAYACSSALYLYDRAGGRFVEALRMPENAAIEEIALSPDSKKLAVRTMEALFVYSIRQ
jgi:hypothetical protein